MWDGLLILLLLSICLGASSFLAGQVPLSFTLTPRQLRLLTALGTGILVGTSLIVIIPEGVDTLYSSASATHVNGLRSREWRVLPRQYGTEGADVLPDPLDTTYPTGLDETFQHLDDPFPSEGSGDGDGSPFPGDDSFGQDTQTSSREPHVYIGISLILGFILMYLIDTLPQTATASLRPQRFHVSLNHLSFNRTSDGGDAGEAQTADRHTHSSTASSGSSSRPSSTTVGLVIHAAADGIALGASSTASGNLSFIIFLALMFHKAPAAFGLTTALLKQGLGKRQARLHLIVFSLAAPAAALLTWLAIHLLGFSSSSFGDSTSNEFATGLLLLFSAGTFLYVAMHTMQESGDHAVGSGSLNGYTGVSVDDPYDSVHGMQPPPKSRGPAVVDTLVTVGGMLLPLLTQWGHAH